MALFRAIETGRSRNKRLFDDTRAAMFLDRELKLVAGMSSVPVIGRIVPLIIQKIAPGALSSGIARTKYIDDLLHEAVIQGVRQVVILGAGFDTRAERLDFLKNIPVIEIDHPDTARFKISVLEKAGTLKKNVIYCQIDFNKKALDGASIAGKINFDAPTAVVWEGVTNYLNEESVDKIFAFLGHFSGQTYVILTYIDRAVIDDPDNFHGIGRLSKKLNEAQEGWSFGFRPAELSAYLKKFKLVLLEDLSAVEYRRRYMPERKSILTGYEFYRVAFARNERRH